MNGHVKTLTELGIEDNTDKLRTVAGFAQKTRSTTSKQRLAGLKPWLKVQELNVTRHAAALRPFNYEEFGTDPASPTDAQIDAVNQLISSLRVQLMEMSRQVGIIANFAMNKQDTNHLQQLMIGTEQAHDWVRAVEQIWDFYFELFGQRQSRFGNWLLGCDRIAMDCYQDIYIFPQRF
jgi:hypothetical protein